VILWGGCCDSVTKWHMRREGVNQNVTWHFLSIFKENFTTRLFFCKMKMSRHTRRGWVCVPHKGGLGSKISQKSVTFYLNGPLNLLYFLQKHWKSLLICTSMKKYFNRCYSYRFKLLLTTVWRNKFFVDNWWFVWYRLVILGFDHP